MTNARREKTMPTDYEQHYSGANWLRGKVAAMSPFGERVADLVGEAYRGLYHVEGGSLFKADWGSDEHVTFSVYDAWFSTYDGDLLTRLVVLSHDRCIRFQVHPSAPRHLRLSFTNRERDTDSFLTHHPTLEEHTAAIRENRPI